jgi:plastocyanin domain-containing protein
MLKVNNKFISIFILIMVTFIFLTSTYPLTLAQHRPGHGGGGGTTPTEAPGKPALSHDNYDNDGNYIITMNMYYGVNGTSWNLYENGLIVYSGKLRDQTPNAQSASATLSGQGPGNYTYQAELINAVGSTMSDPIQVTVNANPPGTPVLSHDNYDNDGNYIITMNMDYGPNATSWQLYEDDVVVFSETLKAKTPNAQSSSVGFTAQAPGIYTYRAELTNVEGSTMSEPIQVTVEARPPGTSTLSHNNYDNDGNYIITMNMDYGPNATSWQLYEDDVVVFSGALVDNSPNAQTASVEFTNQAPGIYTYKAELMNADGSTMGTPVEVTVEVKLPGTPILIHDNNNNDGNFTITMNMNYGPNGTSWKLFKDELLVYTDILLDNSPNAQSASVEFTNQAVGSFTFKAELINEHGSTMSEPIIVTVNDNFTGELALNFDDMQFEGTIGNQLNSPAYFNQGTSINTPHYEITTSQGFQLYISGTPFQSAASSTIFSIERLSIAVTGSSTETYQVGTAFAPTLIDSAPNPGTSTIFLRTVDFHLDLTVENNPFTDNDQLKAFDQIEQFSSTLTLSLTKL